MQELMVADELSKREVEFHIHLLGMRAVLLAVSLSGSLFVVQSLLMMFNNPVAVNYLNKQG